MGMHLLKLDYQTVVISHYVSFKWFVLFFQPAPEVVGRQRYGQPVDCWALGVIMYILWVYSPVNQNQELIIPSLQTAFN